jgi:hypothetical protein
MQIGRSNLAADRRLAVCLIPGVQQPNGFHSVPRAQTFLLARDAILKEKDPGLPILKQGVGHHFGGY